MIDHSKACSLLVKYVPRGLAAIFGPRGTKGRDMLGGACLTVAYMAEAVLEELGIKSERYPCEVTLLNPAYIARVLNQPADGEPIIMRVGLESPVRGDTYRGHLTLIVPSARTMLDLDIGQFNGKHPSLVMPADAAEFEWSGTTNQTIKFSPERTIDAHFYMLPTGGAIAYNDHPEPLLYRESDGDEQWHRKVWSSLIREIVTLIKRKAQA